MTILASLDMFIVRIQFDSTMHSTDLLSSFRFRSAGTLGVLGGVYYIFSYLNRGDLKYYITSAITFPCREESKSAWINR